MINWKVRFKNKLWVTGFASQVLIVIQMLLVGANKFGLTDFVLTEAFEAWILGLVNAIFIVLSMLGIVQDPTVEGIEDSTMTLRKEEPDKNERRLP